MILKWDLCLAKVKDTHGVIREIVRKEYIVILGGHWATTPSLCNTIMKRLIIKTMDVLTAHLQYYALTT